MKGDGGGVERYIDGEVEGEGKREGGGIGGEGGKGEEKIKGKTGE